MILNRMDLKKEVRIISGTANTELSESVAKYLGVKLLKADIGKFPNGETRVQLEESVRGMSVFIIQPTCPPTNDNLMELLIILDACRRASAGPITVIVPYFGYAKQDKKKEGREPITSKLVADLLQTAGARRLVTIDLHAKQIEGFFNIPVDNLSGLSVVADHFLKHKMQNVVVVAPDAGGVKRARDLANKIKADGLAIIDKYRKTYKEASAMNVVGNVEGMNAIIVDDFIDTGGSIVEAVKAVQNHKAKSVWIAATHGLLTDPAIKRIKEADVKEIILTDTIPIPKEKMLENMKVMSVAPLIGESIKNIIGKGSLFIYR